MRPHTAFAKHRDTLCTGHGQSFSSAPTAPRALATSPTRSAVSEARVRRKRRSIPSLLPPDCCLARAEIPSEGEARGGHALSGATADGEIRPRITPEGIPAANYPSTSPGAARHRAHHRARYRGSVGGGVAEAVSGRSLVTPSVCHPEGEPASLSGTYKHRWMRLAATPQQQILLASACMGPGQRRVAALPG